MSYLLLLISSFIINAGEIFCAHKIVNKGIKFNSYKIYLSYFIMVGLIYINYIFSNNLYKVFITLIIMFLIAKILFNKSIKKSIIIAVIMELSTILAELVFALIISFIKNIDTNALAQTYQGTIFTNGLISLNLCLLSMTKIPNKLYKAILSIVENLSVNKVAIFLSIVIACSSLLFYLSYYNNNKVFSLIVNFAITTIYFAIIVMLMNKESKYNKIYSKYLITINDLKEYETIINQYRIINHENNNQLLTIKGMTANKKVIEYIDEILNSKNSENKDLIKQALLIPTGGLRGLVYSKLIIMKDKNIDYMLNIDRKVNSNLMKNISSKEMIDICQIVGVYLDNSIEAVEKLDQKQIIINIFKDNGLNIEIINNYKEKIEIHRIDKIGYSTKGSGHGYGLALVSKILKENKNFSNEREVNDKIFKQKLIVKC